MKPLAPVRRTLFPPFSIANVVSVPVEPSMTAEKPAIKIDGFWPNVNTKRYVIISLFLFTEGSCFRQHIKIHSRLWLLHKARMPTHHSALTIIVSAQILLQK